MASAEGDRVVSSFRIIKGALIQETHAVFAAWDEDVSKAANLQRVRELNPFGARSASWLRDVIFAFSSRFEPAGRDRPLLVLAKAGCSMDVWKPLMLWHMTRDEFLVRDFLLNWLHPAYEDGTYQLRPRDVDPFLRTIEERGGHISRPWTESTVQHVSAALLKIAADFGLLKGAAVKQFTSYHVPDSSFLYLLHALSETEPNARRIVESPEWRMYLMRPDDVERELLRLHQFRKLEYQVAGSLSQLRLPCTSAVNFAEQVMQ